MFLSSLGLLIETIKIFKENVITTICIKNDTLAADGLCVEGHYIYSTTFQKLWTVPRIAHWGLAGCADLSEVLYKTCWQEENFAAILNHIKDHLDGNSSVIAWDIKEQVGYSVVQKGYSKLTPKHLREGYAVGSGSMYATAAMGLGLDAKEAVKEAAKYCLYTNNKVKTIKLY